MRPRDAIGRLPVAGALAVVTALLAVVLSLPITVAILLTAVFTPYDAPSAFDGIIPVLLFALIGLPGGIAARIVRCRHPDGNMLRSWTVLLTSAAGVALAIVGLNGPYLWVPTNHMSIGMRVTQAVADPFVGIFRRHDVEVLPIMAAAAAAGAAVGALHGKKT